MINELVSLYGAYNKNASLPQNKENKRERNVITHGLRSRDLDNSDANNHELDFNEICYLKVPENLNSVTIETIFLHSKKILFMYLFYIKIMSVKR